MITDRGRIYSLGMAAALQYKLRFPVQYISDLFPMDQIPAVKNRNSRKIGKCGIYQIIVLPHPADGRIGIKSRKNRVFTFHDFTS